MPHPGEQPIADGHAPVEHWVGLFELNLRHLDTPNPTLPTLGLRETTPTGWLWGQSRMGIGFRPWHWLELFAVEMYDDANGFMHGHTGVGVNLPTSMGMARLEVGALMPASGHPGLPSWALPSLFVQTVMGHEHWSDEGATLAWHGANGSLQLGRFAGSGYRGGSGTRQNPAMWEVAGTWYGEDLALTLHASRIDKVQRQVDLKAPHTHGSVTAGCGVITNCFAGSATLGGLVLQWNDDRPGPHVATSLDWRHENGALEGTLGRLDYRGDIVALAAETGWTWDTGTVALRWEDLSIVHNLTGANAAATSYLLGIDRGDFNPMRIGLRLAWHLSPQQTLALESVRERAEGWNQRILGQWHLQLGKLQGHVHGGGHSH